MNAAQQLFNSPYGSGTSWEVKSETTAVLFDSICAIESSVLYKNAFDRWAGLWGSKQKRTFRAVHRVLIGLSETNLWKSGISIDPVYGMPVIPGAACKGLAVHFAQQFLQGESKDGGMTEETRNRLFGNADSAGEVCFMDAWWVPESGPLPLGHSSATVKQPFVREVVTPHHPKFQNTKGLEAATPFDSPVPSPQIAMHGSFLFVIDGTDLWAAHALNVLELALGEMGIGARTPEYGQMQPT
jgi:CRISPR-associated protein Cmr6